MARASEFFKSKPIPSSGASAQWGIPHQKSSIRIPVRNPFCQSINGTLRDQLVRLLLSLVGDKFILLLYGKVIAT